ncbi:MAG: hypothetical protein KA436_08995 [Oligoflexales bacterium]|nr:hypothetical protein [Oligoflexales bacterium]
MSEEKKDTWSKEVRTIKKQDMCKGLGYQAICGEILVDSPSGDIDKKESGKVFYTAYFSDQIRPVIFFFNGGPGAASVWLHLGAFGPKRVDGLDVDSHQHALVENQETLLNVADLVFVDPIGTGFSSCREGLIKEFCGEKTDASYLSQFIIKFMSSYKIWDRPIYLCGESYGGYRSALINYELITKYGLHTKGMILVAPFLSGISTEESAPNIIAEAHFLCGYIVSAWYHGRSSLSKLGQDEQSIYQKAKQFAYQEYLPARLKSPLYQLDSELLEHLANMSGIDLSTLKKEGLNIQTFCAHLFPGEHRYPGRIDSRYTLQQPVSFSPIYLDPSTVLLSQKLSPATNTYLRQELGWESADSYVMLSKQISEIWQYEEPFYSSAFEALRAGLKLSPRMSIYTAAGYYDLAVPLASVEYDLLQLADTAELAQRLRLEHFAAGHMMYVQEKSRKKLSQSIQAFIRET